MSIFEKFKTKQSVSRLAEEMLYAQVAEEIQNGIKRNGLWAKAIADAELNEDKAKAIYIKLRVQSLIDEYNIKESKIDSIVDSNKEKIKSNNVSKKDIAYSTNSIGTSSRELTCLNCNRNSKMLIKKVPMTLTEKILFTWLGGIPGFTIGSIITSSIDSLIPSLFAFISYIAIYFILFNKKQMQCPSCGNTGLIN
jgi:hypothetical protein